MNSGPLLLLTQVASLHHAHPAGSGKGFAKFSVSPPLPSGAPATSYDLTISSHGSSVSVRETSTAILPGACPERHINTDGSFCLYWEQADPHAIIDLETAAAWWRRLLLFLSRQRSAHTLRRWPGQADAWAHGTDAARHQRTAMDSAQRLGPRFLAMLRSGRFKTVRRSHNGDIRIRLEFDGQILISVDKARNRVMTSRTLCKCDGAAKRQLPICSCSDHAIVMVDFVNAIDAWRAEEAAFIENAKAMGQKCCGTMDDCPLASF